MDKINPFDLDKVRLGVDNNRLSALLCAVLESQGGHCVVPPDIAEKVYEGYSLDYKQIPGGAIRVKLVAPEGRH